MTGEPSKAEIDAWLAECFDDGSDDLSPDAYLEQGEMAANYAAALGWAIANFDKQAISIFKAEGDGIMPPEVGGRFDSVRELLQKKQQAGIALSESETWWIPYFNQQRKLRSGVSPMTPAKLKSVMLHLSVLFAINVIEEDFGLFRSRNDETEREGSACDVVAKAIAAISADDKRSPRRFSAIKRRVTSNLKALDDLKKSRPALC
ncbi:MAG: hypothetical protein KGH84_11585, partial [Paracoccaceae bacterium]|nr:hypothetical protein [Paracoccaceae bacterium]